MLIKLSKMAKVIETNMSDGRDLVWYWNTIGEAINSGRFEWLEDSDTELLDEAFDKITIEEFIETIGYPFFIEK